jgi:RHS repeat-associated protein
MVGGRERERVRCDAGALRRDRLPGQVRFLHRQTASGPVSWMGSLMQDGQDASGLMFRRNRFYDPASGRFTQEDPIGLAGGVNSYGFAEGDPIGNSDPFGLCSPSDLRDCTSHQMQNMVGVAHRIAWYDDPLFYFVTGAVELSTRAGATLAGRAAGSLAERGLARLALNSSTRPLEQILYVGETVGRLRLGQNAAARLITNTLNRLGYEIGEEVTRDGARYLISKTTKNGVSHALEILGNGAVNTVRVRGSGAGMTIIR